MLKSFIIMSLWGVGGGMIIYLAGLQSVPTQLYEAAEIDGAGSWQKFRNVTLPMISPTLFFNLIMGIIGSFQVFTSSFIMTQGGPGVTHRCSTCCISTRKRSSICKWATPARWPGYCLRLSSRSRCSSDQVSKAWVYYEAELKR